MGLMVWLNYWASFTNEVVLGLNPFATTLFSIFTTLGGCFCNLFRFLIAKVFWSFKTDGNLIIHLIKFLYFTSFAAGHVYSGNHLFFWPIRSQCILSLGFRLFWKQAYEVMLFDMWKYTFTYLICKCILLLMDSLNWKFYSSFQN